MFTRRDFIGALGAGMAAGPLALAGEPKTGGRRKKMAIVTTVWRYQSHAQHMGDRFLVGYPMHGRWHQPGLDVVALYVDQKPEGQDQSQQRAEEFGFQVHPTVAEALRAGGDKLAVDAVLLIGEHGEYERNELGQKKYPRYRLFKDIVEVFQTDGRAVPVFNDKHLSWKWEWAKEMVDTARAMNFPLMAGSSLPVTWRMPAYEMPYGAEVEEVMCLAYGGVDSYDFHALEVIQCMAERRQGGETGVAWVQGLRGEAAWRALEAGSFAAGGFSPELFQACLARSHNLVSPKAGFGHRRPTIREIQTMVKDPIVYRIGYRDGLKATMLLMNGLVADFTFAAQLKGRDKLLSTLFYLPPTPNVHYSAVLMSKVEQMFLTGQAVYPVERTLLTSGILAASIGSLAAGGSQTETPHLDVRYESPRASLFCRR